MVRAPTSTTIGQGWQYSLTNANGTDTGEVKVGEWVEVKNFPTTVHVELLEAKKIPDPFLGLSEWDVQWVGESDWSFKTTFAVDQNQYDAENIDLVFQGLDTFASVELNGKQILESSNQFVSYSVGVKNALNAPGQDNELVVHFTSAFRQGRQIEQAHKKYHLWNGDSSRLHVRKAQYNYGWDWGPVLMTTGPWKPIVLETYHTRIGEIRVDADVDEQLAAAVEVTLAVEGVEKDTTAIVRLVNAEGKAIASKEVDVTASGNGGTVAFSLDKGSFELWYPVGYGKQPLYEATIELKDKNNSSIDKKSQPFAFRRALVVQDELDEGHTFLFEVNNIRIFCGGSNWIPADSFLTTMTKDRYRAWLQLLVDGNQNMIRVWGGGIYESDDFYDICDELGILVWQDFMFGCGQYPGYPEFLAQVEVEAVQNVKRLRHHPSMVIFAGNNEDYQLIESLNISLNDEEKFPAQKIYEELLPAAVAKHCKIHYHRSSPYSGFGKPTTDQKNGDLHQWNVWHGSQEPWHNWDKLSGRFVSEFGMEAYPDVRTAEYWLGGNKAEWFPQSRTSANHNKADGFERRLELYLMENFRHAFDMESYIYYTQIMQAETLAAAYRLWRRNWKGRGKEYTAGALVWQINDCWPTTSWAIADYFLRPKPAFHAIARELRPVTVGTTRKEHTTHPDAASAAKLAVATELQVWGANSTLAPVAATLELASFDLADAAYAHRWLARPVTLAPNASTELFAGAVPELPVRTTRGAVPRAIVVSARLLDAHGGVLARSANWPEPYKFLAFPAAASLGLTVEPTTADGVEAVRLAAQRPVKGVVLDVEGGGGAEVRWGDQAIDLVPGDAQVVTAVGLKGRKVATRFLGDGTA